jgi:hypothetical protein
MTFCFSVIMAPQHECQEVECGQEAGTHQSIGGGTSPSIWRHGHLDLQWLPLQRAGSLLGVGLSPRLSPLFAFPVEVPLLSTMVANSRHRPQLGGAFSESCNEVIVFVFFSP